MATITCKDCGLERKGCPSNTLRCQECALLRQAAYWTYRTRTCRAMIGELGSELQHCGTTFAPISRSDHQCGKCHGRAEAHGYGPKGACLACKRHEPLLLESLPVCVQCLRDPDQRSAIHTLLVDRQSARRSANAA